MNVYAQLIDWINQKELPYWEQYALDRIIAGKPVNQTEIDRMVTYILEDGSVIKKDSARPQLIALKDAAAAASKAATGKTVLRGLSKTKNINALAPDQQLEFGDQLTVIFGANSSGKSGYARLLANAGFSRGDDQVLPDVNNPSAAAAPIEAVFHLEQEGTIKDVKFVVGKDCPEMKKLYVHDTASIVTHLTESSEFSFSPLGLDALGDLAEICDTVGEALTARIAEWNKPSAFLDKFEGKSPVRDLIQTLSAKTDLDALKALSALSDAEKAKKKEIETKSAKLRSRSVTDEIAKCNQQITDLKSLIGHLEELVEGTSSEIANAIGESLSALAQHKKQAEKVGLDQFKTEMFNTIGSAEWQSFLEAAHDLSKTERESPPYPHEGDHCLFCRQTLDENALALIRRYWAFLEDDSRQKIRQTEAALSRQKTSLDEIEVDFFGESTVAYRLIQKGNAETLAAVKMFVQAAKNRKKQLITGLVQRKSFELAALPESPVAALEEIQKALEEKIKALKASDPAKEIETLEGHLRAFEHRQKLAQQMDAIAEYVNSLRIAEKASKLRPNTKHISLMQGRMFDSMVTGEYIKRFKNNLKTVGRPLPVEVRTRNTKGTALKEIHVSKGNYEATRILCDGEKRIASLADFLTEVSLDPDAMGIVLDDPVCSLDIEWKEHVAKRLVMEAKERQTIIFTHDLHFVHLVTVAAAEENVDTKCHWIIRATEPDGTPGNVYLNNSPALEKDYKKPTVAESYLKQAASANPQDREQLLRVGFSALRTSYEAFLIYDLFGGVVERFQERTRMDLLTGVFLDKAIFEKVKEKHAYLSRFMEGHLHSDQAAAKKPTVELLGQQIEEFKVLKKQVKDAKND